MATANFGEWGAFTVRNDVRFQKTVDGRKRLVKEAEVPKEVADLLRKNLGTLGKTKDTLPEKPVNPDPAPTEPPKYEQVEEPDPRKELDYAKGNEEYMGKAYKELKAENDQLKTVISNMDAFAIHTAAIKDIAQALFDRFGIYTVWLGRFPEPDEVNPFTGEPMSNYERGVAYQAAIRAQARGLVDPEVHAAQLKANQAAAQNITYAPQPQTFAQHRDTNSFDYRTSVEGERDRASGTVSVSNPDDSSDPIAEPQMGKQIIRPGW